MGPSLSPFFNGVVTTVGAHVPADAFTQEERAEKFQEQTLVVPAASLVAVCRALKTQHGFAFLMDVCGVDWPGREKRFDVVYHLYNDAANERVRIKVPVGEGESVPTITGVWPGDKKPEVE